MSDGIWIPTRVKFHETRHIPVSDQQNAVKIKMIFTAFLLIRSDCVSSESLHQTDDFA